MSSGPVQPKNTHRQTEMVYSNVAAGTIFGVLVAIVLAVSSYLVESGLHGFLWLVAALGTFLAHTYFVNAYFQDQERSLNTTYWYKVLLVLALVSGSLWGLASWLLFADQSVLLKFFIYTVLASIAALSVSVYSARYSIFMAFSLPLLVITAIETTRHDAFLLVFGGFLILLGAVLARVSWRYNGDIREMCQLEGENIHLNAQLEDANKNEKTAIREQNQLIQTLEDAGVMTWRTDADGLLRSISPRICQLSGLSSSEMVGLELISLINFDTTTASPRTNIEFALGHRRPFREIECKIETASGETVILAASAKPIEAGDVFDGFEGYFRDVTIERATIANLTHRAQHDTVTGLINRSQFIELLSEYIPLTDARSGTPYVMYIELRNLEIINDYLGMHFGDTMASQLAELLKNVISDKGSVGRLGSGFGILLKPCNEKTALSLAENAVNALNDHRMHENGQNFSILARGGLAAIDVHMSTAAEALDCADLASRKCDVADGSYLSLFKSELRAQQPKQGDKHLAELVSDLENHKLCLQFQPIVDLQSHQTVWLEALLASRDDDGTKRLIGKALIAAEEYDIIERFDKWVVSESIRSIASNPGVSSDGVLINVSPLSMQNRQFPNYVFRQLELRSVDASKICFDITAGIQTSDHSAAADSLMRLRRRGCKVSLDDFGTGSSSLENLKHLPVNYLKINHVFLEGLGENDMDQLICKAIVDLAQRGGCEVIAESVQDLDKLPLLKDLGISLAQGYALGTPKDITDFVKSEVDERIESAENVVNLHDADKPSDTSTNQRLAR